MSATAAIVLAVAAVVDLGVLAFVAWIAKQLIAERRELMLLLAAAPAVNVTDITKATRRRTQVVSAMGDGAHDPDAARNYRDDRRNPPPMVGLGNEQ